MRTILALLALFTLLQQRPNYSVVQDGEPHGDPPYLLEEGWQPLLNGSDLSGWKACDAAKSEWFTTSFVRFEPHLSPTQLHGRAAPAGVILNGPTGRTANLCTGRTFGDVELYLEFMLSKGSNSGVYLHSLYEVQIFDSSDSTVPMTTSDGGAIYHQWIDERGLGRPASGSRIRSGFADRGSTRRGRKSSRPVSSGCCSMASSCSGTSMLPVLPERTSRSVRPR
jgi:hypothetical protein